MNNGVDKYAVYYDYNFRWKLAQQWKYCANDNNGIQKQYQFGILLEFYERKH